MGWMIVLGACVVVVEVVVEVEVVVVLVAVLELASCCAALAISELNLCWVTLSAWLRSPLSSMVISWSWSGWMCDMMSRTALRSTFFKSSLSDNLLMLLASARSCRALSMWASMAPFQIWFEHQTNFLYWSV